VVNSAGYEHRIGLFKGEEAILATLDRAAEVFIPAIVIAKCSLERQNLAGLLRTLRGSTGSRQISFFTLRPDSRQRPERLPWHNTRTGRLV
jgi:hypothetical protein